MIKLHEVQKIYTSLSGGQHVLKNINLYFEKGQFVAILGKSGCGKTTLLNLIASIDTPSSGYISINDKLLNKMSDKELDEFRNRKLGIIYQNYNLVNHLTVLDNVLLALEIANKKDKEKAIEILKRVGLEDHLHKYVNQLSGGQKQRVAIARALVNEPDVLLADEPTGALDSKTSIEIMDLIKEICKDKLVIFVTHNKDLADKYANRIIEMKDGRVINDTNPSDNRVSLNLDKKLVENKLGLINSLKYSFKAILKNKTKSIFISLGLAIGITLMVIVDGLFNVPNEKTETYKNSPIIEIYNRDEVNIDDIKKIDGINDAFEIVSEIYASKLDDKEIKHYFNNIIKTPNQDMLYKRFENLIDYGSMPTNDNEIVISYNDALSLANSKLSDDQIAEYLLGKTITFDVYEKYTLSEDSIKTLELLSTNYHASKENETCIKYYVENDVYKTYEDLEYDSVIYPKGTNLLDLKDLIKDFDYINQSILYSEYKNTDYSYFISKDTAYINNIYETLATSPIEYKIVGIFNQSTYCRMVKNIIKHNISDENMIICYIDLDKIDNKIDIIKNLEKFGRCYDYSFENDDYQANRFVMKLMGFVFVAISSITLVTAGIMLWLLLHTSITQRKKEIGLLRSMGSTKNDVKMVFISETLIIGVFACLISTILIITITLLTNYIVPKYFYKEFVEKLALLNPNKPITINISKLFIIYGIGILVSFIAGLIPSSKAGGKKPIDVLRGEK